jgi:hypothetical protein
MLAVKVDGAKSASVDGLTISPQIQIKKNTENAGLSGFPEWNVSCDIPGVPVRTKRAGSRR